MKSHIQYFWYVLRHKWHVFVAGLYLEVPLWRLITHDWSKFTPAEWGPYVRRFYGGRGGVLDKAADPEEFRQAWAHHWQRNPHHPEYWAGGECTGAQHGGTGDPSYLQGMPDTYVREMVADWYGAGMAQGKPDIIGWYQEHRGKLPLHPTTRQRIEQYLGKLKSEGIVP